MATSLFSRLKLWFVTSGVSCHICMDLLFIIALPDLLLEADPGTVGPMVPWLDSRTNLFIALPDLTLDADPGTVGIMVPSLDSRTKLISDDCRLLFDVLAEDGDCACSILYVMKPPLYYSTHSDTEVETFMVHCYVTMSVHFRCIISIFFLISQQIAVEWTFWEYPYVNSVRLWNSLHYCSCLTKCLQRKKKKKKVTRQHLSRSKKRFINFKISTVTVFSVFQYSTVQIIQNCDPQHCLALLNVGNVRFPWKLKIILLKYLK